MRELEPREFPIAFERPPLNRRRSTPPAPGLLAATFAPESSLALPVLSTAAASAASALINISNSPDIDIPPIIKLTNSSSDEPYNVAPQGDVAWGTLYVPSGSEDEGETRDPRYGSPDL